MKYYAVIDANVLVSAALKWQSVPGSINELFSHAISISEEHLDVDLPDPKDRVFYEVTMQARKDEDAYLVTGNMKHFPTKPYVVTPKQMLDIILNASNDNE
ncbi:hypothetical protein ACTNEN_12975 [Oribacterium sp. HCP28S3_H8]|uniref:hypothetical protein n=1 Tax=Oribacterium sp. HCP28S3_H8 TaxID=3438945 RepID=UPI003F8A7C45